MQGFRANGILLFARRWDAVFFSVSCRAAERRSPAVAFGVLENEPTRFAGYFRLQARFGTGTPVLYNEAIDFSLSGHGRKQQTNTAM